MANPKQKTKGTPDPVDKHVGQRLRVRRSLMGVSQEKLAEAIGLTFQQIQKYERGTNRISAGRLFQFSKILEVPIAYFYEQFEKEPNQSNAAYGLADNEQETLTEFDDVMRRKETLDLIRVYYSIDDPIMRKDLFKFVKSMAERMADS